MPTEAESLFNEAMLNIYRRAKAEAGYNATRFLNMVVEHGGLETARYLLHAATVSEGYTALWERKRLDLTVEAMILQPEWQALFSDAEGRPGNGRSFMRIGEQSRMPGHGQPRSARCRHSRLIVRMSVLGSNREYPDTPIWADLAVRGVTMPIGPMNPGLAKGAAGV